MLDLFTVGSPIIPKEETELASNQSFFIIHLEKRISNVSGDKVVQMNFKSFILDMICNLFVKSITCIKYDNRTKKVW